ncbi:MAG: radical SAM protein, partial [Leptospiraceae bacterium]|nr:radical SAM protein [Leptospiraceae bacterium]
SGFVYRQNEQSIRNRPADVVSDLDQLPSPVLANMMPAGSDNKNGLGIMLEGTRACPFRCAFCFEGDKQTKTRFASLERLRAEATFLSNRGPHHIHMLDPILCASRRERLEGLGDILRTIRERSGTFISVEAYADLITPAVADCLQVGSVLDIGLQSINQQTTKSILRPFKREKWLRGVQYLRERDIKFNVYLISGLPFETVLTFLQGVEFTLRENPFRLFFNELCLLNGTLLRRNAAEYDYEFDSQAPYFVYGNRWMPRPVLAFVQAFAKVIERNYSYKASILFSSLPWMKARHRCGMEHDARLKHDLHNGLPLSDNAEPGASIELQGSGSFEDQILLQSAAQVLLSGYSRIILRTDFENLVRPQTVVELVNRGVFHFKFELDLERFDRDLQYKKLSSRILSSLACEFSVSGGARVRPVIDIEVVNCSAFRQLDEAVAILVDRLGVIWNTWRDDYLEAAEQRQQLFLLLQKVTPARSWIRMSRASMSDCLQRFSQIPGEHNLASDQEEILAFMQNLGLTGVRNV